MFTLSNLHSIASDAFTVSNVCHGFFIYNGQLDTETTNAPCFKNLVNVFRGDRYFEEIYLLGDTFDQYKVPKDTYSKENVVKRTKSEI